MFLQYASTARRNTHVATPYILISIRNELHWESEWADSFGSDFLVPADICLEIQEDSDVCFFIDVYILFLVNCYIVYFKKI